MEAFKKSRNIYGSSNKASEIRLTIALAEDESAELLTFLKSHTPKNRKMMVDLNLRLAVVHTTNREIRIKMDKREVDHHKKGSHSKNKSSIFDGGDSESENRVEKNK